MSTLLLTRADVARHLEALTLMQALREGFIAHSATAHPDPSPAAPQRTRAVVHEDGTAVVVFPGLAHEVPAYSVKVSSKYPQETPAIQGVLHLFDRQTGALLAIMESGQLTALRTGLAAAISADALARPDAAHVALIGAGRQSSVTLKCLRLVRSLRQVSIFDLDFVKADELAQRTYDGLSLPARPTTSIEEAVAGADLVVCATFAREPLLYPGMLKNGCHVISLGADEPGKVELSAPLIRQSRYFVDDRALTRSSGTIGTLKLEDSVITAELGEVLSGNAKGRLSDEDITLFSGVGLPFQDLLAAWSVYESALQDDSVQRIDFA